MFTKKAKIPEKKVLGNLRFHLYLKLEDSKSPWIHPQNQVTATNQDNTLQF